jgi:hypothetical protein
VHLHALRYRDSRRAPPSPPAPAHGASAGAGSPTGGQAGTQAAVHADGPATEVDVAWEVVMPAVAWRLLPPHQPDREAGPQFSLPLSLCISLCVSPLCCFCLSFCVGVR